MENMVKKINCTTLQLVILGTFALVLAPILLLPFVATHYVIINIIGWSYSQAWNLTMPKIFNLPQLNITQGITLCLVMGSVTGIFQGLRYIPRVKEEIRDLISKVKTGTLFAEPKGSDSKEKIQKDVGESVVPDLGSCLRGIQDEFMKNMREKARK